MRQNGLEIQSLGIEMNSSDQPVLVVTDVEHETLSYLIHPSDRVAQRRV